MEKKTSHLFPTYARWSLHIEYGEGSYLYSKDGKKYLDFVSGIAVCNLGHRHHAVESAVSEQMQKYWHLSNLFPISLQEEVAEILTSHSDTDLAFFCNSGAEANEAAIKLARKYTKRHKIITFEKSFHGRTFATMSATGQAKIHDGYGPLLPEFVYLPLNDSDALEATMNTEVAAVMVEIVQGEGGVVVAQDEFLQKLAALCQQNGTLLIVDEVQTGIGRTGTAFAYQHVPHLSPDIITSAKGIANGLPLGVMLGKMNLAEAFGPGSHGSTFGGNPLSLAAAKASLEIIFNDAFLQTVSEKGCYLRDELKKHVYTIPFVKDIRGKGLMIGIACEVDVSSVIVELQQQGLLALTAGPNVIRLLPPLTISQQEMDEAVTIITDVLNNYCV
ncbi:acetylornithine transaminase [Bacillus sp. HMF5848]|uniref:acetylornithine transaminase n=1 Tax=Bacillus sp. HMF5848 TaxID=2495421 RepID=UPI0021AD7794|nr:acetylornithine transaminase [Bacillus sp. HMF5848]